MSVKPVLVIGFGNPDRGDDGAGIELADRLAGRLDAADAERVEVRTAVQLMIEHATWLDGRRRVVFVDAATDAPPPCRVSVVEAARDRSYTSHQLSPAALLEVQQRAYETTPEEALLLAIPGSDFAMGRGLSGETARCLPDCLDRLLALVTRA